MQNANIARARDTESENIAGPRLAAAAAKAAYD